jgi:hypothetical protein
VYRSAVIAIRQRAGQQHADAIEAEAGRLLEQIDGKRGAEHAEDALRAFEIFRTGRHTSSDGRTIEFSARDLEASANAYNPAVHEAPIVVGHPRTDDPAYGWVTGLACSGGSLFARPGDVDPEFADLVRAGRFRKISASFYMPDSAQNPAPGVYYLRHVGFLGAQPPALKGLKPVAFADGGEGLIDFDTIVTDPGRRARKMPKPNQETSFHEGGVKRIVHHLHRLREHLIRKHGQEEADTVIPHDEIEEMEREGRHEGEIDRLEREQHAAAPHEAAAYSEPALAKREEDLKKREAEFAEREKKILEKEKEAVHNGHVQFCDGLVKEGRMLPVNKAAAVAQLDFLASLDSAGVVEFEEGSGKKKISALDNQKAILTAQPKVVTYGEVVRPGDGGADTEDATREALIADYQEKHKGPDGKPADYKEALLEVSKIAPHLFGLAVKPKQQ